MNSVLSWLRQTTTVHGLALAAGTAVASAAANAPLWATMSGVAGSLVLLALPGQGDFAGKISQAVQDVGSVVQSKGDPAAVGTLLLDGLTAAESLPLTTTTTTVVSAGTPPHP